MKNNDSLFWFALVTLTLLLSFWFGYRYSKCTLNYQSLRNLHSQNSLEATSIYEEIAYLRGLELETENHYLPNINLLDTSGARFDINKIVNKGVWVFRFHESSCYPCIEENLQLIYNKAPENFIILASFSDFNSFQAFAREQNVKNIFFVDTNTNSTLIASEKFFLPIYFGLSESLQLMYPTIPLRGSIKLSEQFLYFARNNHF